MILIIVLRVAAGSFYIVLDTTIWGLKTLSVHFLVRIFYIIQFDYILLSWISSAIDLLKQLKDTFHDNELAMEAILDEVLLFSCPSFAKKF